MVIAERLVKRFWLSVEKGSEDECWPWRGSFTSNGYGRFVVGQGRRMRAHRLSYSLTHGSIPGQMLVMHICDNPPCCNPAHLRLGTQADNMADMVAKGRSKWFGGVRKHSLTGRKLTQADAAEIRALAAAGPVSCTALGKRFGVHRTTIAAVVSGRSNPGLRRSPIRVGCLCGWRGRWVELGPCPSCGGEMMRMEALKAIARA